MISERDLHTFAICLPWPAHKPIGTFYAEYEVRRFVDVRNLGVARGYRIVLRQRVSIPNDGASNMGSAEIVSFTYPVMVDVRTTLLPGSTQQQFYLTDVTPKSLNASVSATATGSQASQSSATSTVTSGSSTSQVNTFEFGLMPSSSSSESQTQFSSNSNAVMAGASSGSAMSDTMAVKDWSSYVSLDAALQNPRWIWAQTFPWDVVKYHYTDAEGNVTLPDAIEDLLFQTMGSSKAPLVIPPTGISLFGLNFAMQAEWIYLVNGAAPVDELSFTHVIAPYTGSHGLVIGNKAVTLTQNSENQLDFPSPTFDLGLLALDPILPGNSIASAVVGFVKSQFIVLPSNPLGFAITSGSNILLVRGDAGAPFTDPISDDAPMTADLTGGGSSASMTVYFKIVDEESDLSLYLKHWKTHEAGILLTLVVNHGEPIFRHVESLEAGSGSDNVSRIILRRKSLKADEYFNYLVPGLNSIQISAAPDYAGETPPPSPVPDCGYALRAVAIS